MGRFQLESKLKLIFRLHHRPIQLVVFVPVGLLSFLRHRRQTAGVEITAGKRPLGRQAYMGGQYWNES